MLLVNSCFKRPGAVKNAYRHDNFCFFTNVKSFVALVFPALKGLTEAALSSITCHCVL